MKLPIVLADINFNLLEYRPLYMLEVVCVICACYLQDIFVIFVRSFLVVRDSEGIV